MSSSSSMSSSRRRCSSVMHVGSSTSSVSVCVGEDMC